MSTILINFLKKNGASSLERRTLCLCLILLLIPNILIRIIHPFPLNWLSLKNSAIFLSLMGIAYAAAKSAEYPRTQAIASNLFIFLLLGAAINSLLHVLPLSPFPMQDPWLAKADQALHFNLPDFVMKIKTHWPDLSFLLSWLYTTLPPVCIGTLLTSAYLSKKNYTEFSILCAISAALGLWIYFFFPAIGPMASYHYPLSPAEQANLNNISSLKALSNHFHHFVSGDISFPSYHTILALLCAWAWRGYPKLFTLVSVWAALIILSTLSTGWHYLTDVLGGVGVAAISILLWHRLKHSSLLPSRPQVGQAIAGSVLL